ncbi:hypothetical protein [Alicyclobacillus dauci]|uniref:DUF5067 domain-containing protein n=1 Tax=Alicyclobacillus dauci TaxID=1475485 RepID=A0ABY6Z8B8_9BACL|nr:hypothetical protein [Alicyclobacillus dauci]WAH39039.1 hypothetical protein NZD86_11450 [Alicyclobacillus dauci]
MKVKQLCATLLVSVLLVGCGNSDYDSKRQSAIVEQMLPTAIADPPAEVDLPAFRMSNPHVFVNTRSDGITEIYSAERGQWNGKIVNVYYVPPADVKMDEGQYALHSVYPLQRIATTPIKRDLTWSATWNTKGHQLPHVFYILARTNVGQVTIEQVTWNNNKLYVTGAESSLM